MSRWIAALALVALAGECRAGAIEVVRQDWRDAARERTVPVKAFVPADGKRHAVVVFSHGLGATREAYGYLGERWARAGFVAVFLQHAGSDAGIYRPGLTRDAAMKQAVADPQVGLARPLDVRFAIDRLTELARGDSLLGRAIDTARIGLAGHSFGAWTALVVAGQKVADARAPLGDARVRAIIALSPPVKRNQDHDAVYGGITVPCMVMMGTADTSPVGDQRPEDRRIPFDHAHSRESELIVFKGGDHWIYSGRGWKAPPKPGDAEFQRTIADATTAFWNAYLRGDEHDHAWLRGDGLKAELGAQGTLEVR